jgi:uncharacterized membrane protein YphA (DoxX/SURF4 family)
MPSNLEPRRDVAGWIWRGLIAALFAYIGWGKFDSAPNGEWVRIFAKIGLGQWFRVFTGLVEIGGGTLFLFPRTNKVGAALLAAAMLGAIVADVAIGNAVFVIVPLALLAAVVIVAARDPSLDLVRRR